MLERRRLEDASVGTTIYPAIRSIRERKNDCSGTAVLPSSFVFRPFSSPAFVPGVCFLRLLEQPILEESFDNLMRLRQIEKRMRSIRDGRAVRSHMVVVFAGLGEDDGRLRLYSSIASSRLYCWTNS